MSVPVTVRFDDEAVDALDRAVAAGLAPNRNSLIANAVGAWLAHHIEEAIAASYEPRYTEPDEVHDALVVDLARFSMATCLAYDEH